MVRDRTEVQALTRQLDAVNALGTALRAQRHEFANRLHTVAGLLDLGPGRGGPRLRWRDHGQRPAAATRPGTLACWAIRTWRPSSAPRALRPTSGAWNCGSAPDTLMRGHITDPQDVTAVLGNLLDNAILAAVSGSIAQKWVEVELLDELTPAAAPCTWWWPTPGPACQPSRPLADARELIFAPGFSTAAGRTGRCRPRFRPRRGAGPGPAPGPPPRRRRLGCRRRLPHHPRRSVLRPPARRRRARRRTRPTFPDPRRSHEPRFHRPDR